MAWFREWLQGTGGEGATSGSPTPGRPPRSSAGSAGTSGAPGPTRPPRPAETEPEPDGHPGQALGLPQSGQGSVARMPIRLAQFLLDLVLAGLVAALFTYPEAPQNWSLLVWAIFMVLPVATIGMTPAMAMLGIRLLRTDRPDRTGVGVPWTLARTVVLFFVLPAVFVDADGRGLQDRASRTIAIRTR